MMPSTLTAPRTVAIAPATVAQLPDLALTLALYASDYVSERRPDLSKVAAFMLDGANRLGLAELMSRTCDLVAYDQKADDGALTQKDRAMRDGMFDSYRLIHCTLNTRREYAVVRRHLLALDAEAVTA